MPAPLLRLTPGEMSILPLGGQRVVPQRLLASGFIFRYPSLDEALAEACH